MKPEEFLSGLREVLSDSLVSAPVAKSTGGDVTLEDLAGRVGEITKAVEELGAHNEAFDQIAKSFQIIGEHINTHAEVLEKVLDRLEAFDNASAVRKSAAGDDATRVTKGRGPSGTFGSVLAALNSGIPVELR